MITLSQQELASYGLRTDNSKFLLAKKFCWFGFLIISVSSLITLPNINVLKKSNMCRTNLTNHVPCPYSIHVRLSRHYNESPNCVAAHPCLSKFQRYYSWPGTHYNCLSKWQNPLSSFEYQWRIPQVAFAPSLHSILPFT